MARGESGRASVAMSRHRSCNKLARSFIHALRVAASCMASRRGEVYIVASTAARIKRRQRRGSLVAAGDKRREMGGADLTDAKLRRVMALLWRARGQ